jgi:type VI secretion system protein VasD
MKKRLLISVLLFALLCLAGCGKPRLDLNVASQPNVNPDYSGRPSPVLVNVYELRRDLAFKQADFASLFERPVPTLGADLIAADELVFIPGEARKVSYKPAADTRFVGIVAGFRQMERAQWRTIKDIDPEEKNILALEFNDVSILVIPNKKAEDWDPEEAVREFQQGMSRSESRPVHPPSNSHPMAAADESGGDSPLSTWEKVGDTNPPVDEAIKESTLEGASQAMPSASPPALRMMRPY